MTRALALLLLVLGPLCVPTTLSAATPPSYTVIDLGEGTTMVQFMRAAINNPGTVVFRGSDSNAYAWRDNVTTQIPGLTYVGSINARGDMVGIAVREDNSTYSALVRDGAFLEMPVPSGYAGSYANFVNDLGVVAGTLVNATTQAKTVGVWVGDTVYDLGGLGTSSSPVAINGSGQIAGIGMPSSSPYYPLISNSGRMELLAMPGYESFPHDINDLGHIVGDHDETSGPQTAFLWQDGTTQYLPHLATRTYSRAYGISNRGAIVGISYTPSMDNAKTSSAVLWQDGAAYDLNVLGSAGPGCVLTKAWDINDAGWIAAEGYVSGKRHIFVLRPVPEPSTLLALLTAVGGFALWRRRR